MAYVSVCIVQAKRNASDFNRKHIKIITTTTKMPTNANNGKCKIDIIDYIKWVKFIYVMCPETVIKWKQKKHSIVQERFVKYFRQVNGWEWEPVEVEVATKLNGKTNKSVHLFRMSHRSQLPHHQFLSM